MRRSSVPSRSSGSAAVRRLLVVVMACASCGKEAPPAAAPQPAGNPDAIAQARPRDDVGRRVAAAAPAPDADREAKLRAIVPLVRGEAYVEELRRTAPPASRPLAADLHLVYAYKSEGTLTVVPLSEREELAVSPEELDRRAIANLAGVIGDIRLTAMGRIWQVTCGGTYESSLLVMDGLWADFAKQVKGDVVAGCPARDLLFFTDGADPEGVAALRKVVEGEYAKGARTISTRLLRRTAQGWAALEE